MRVLFIAAEATPFVKVGGLADVAGALPQALRRLGVEARLFLPRYGTVDPVRWGLTKVLDNFPTPMDWRHEHCQMLATPDGHTFFLENDFFHGSRFQVYGAGDDVERFVLFCRGALEAVRYMGWTPDVVHAHDWHAAAAIRLHWAARGRGALVFTVHNMAHQGRVGREKWPLLGVYDAGGGLNLMEQAIYTADVVTTVSPTYAVEIKQPQYGEGLDHMLRQRQDRLVGILNGIDPDAWDPVTLPQWGPERFDLRGKMRCKTWLQSQVGLPVREDVPLIGVVTRLDTQKGIDLILGGLHDIIHYSNAQVVVLGSGRGDYEDAFRAASAYNPDRIWSYIGFNAGLARDIYAGSDIFLMPSLFEPCGLSQLIAMRYGTLPVARATGGLVDTVTDMSHPDGVGYLFSHYTVDAMLGALGRAILDYQNRHRWEGAMWRAMNRNFSWDIAAERYREAYDWALSLRG